jgi:hypothetical protein
MNISPFKSYNGKIYEDYADYLKEELDTARNNRDESYKIALEMFSYSIQYIYKIRLLFYMKPEDFYKREIIEMQNRFMVHSVNYKNCSLTFMVNGIIKECQEVINEMEKTQII